MIKHLMNFTLSLTLIINPICAQAKLPPPDLNLPKNREIPRSEVDLLVKNKQIDPKLIKQVSEEEYNKIRNGAQYKTADGGFVLLCIAMVCIYQMTKPGGGRGGGGGGGDWVNDEGAKKETVP